MSWGIRPSNFTTQLSFSSPRRTSTKFLGAVKWSTAPLIITVRVQMRERGRLNILKGLMFVIFLAYVDAKSCCKKGLSSSDRCLQEQHGKTGRSQKTGRGSSNLRRLQKELLLKSTPSPSRVGVTGFGDSQIRCWRSWSRHA
jgi:hypothetical protein